jgi:hypothetical protein
MSIEHFNVFPSISLFHLTAGALDVHNSFYARINPANVMVATGLNHNLKRFIAEMPHQGMNILLEQRFAACDFNKITSVFFHLLKDSIQVQFGAFLESIRCVAPAAPKITSRQPDKDTWPSNACRFTLDAEKDFVDDECVL